MDGWHMIDVKLRRRAMAAFGEAVFYITAQAEHVDTVTNYPPTHLSPLISTSSASNVD